MDIKEAKLILEKINRLYKSMALDERKIDTFEQDLMLSYIKQLYDSFSDENEESVIPQPIRRNRPPALKTKKAVAPAPVAPPVEEIVEELELEIEEPVVIEQVVAPPIVVPPTPVVVTPPEPAPVVKEVVHTTAPAPEPKPINIAKPASVGPSVSTKVASLFEFDEVTDISQKLSQAPITDLKKAIGINEKILTINELFDKNSGYYDEIITRLNGLTSFEQAKNILVQVADQNDWASDGLKKKAVIFIKKVRRRYL